MHSPLEIALNFIEIGFHKAKLSVMKLLILGFFAGFFVGFAGIGATTVGVTIGNGALSRAASALVFPAGLAMVLIAGGELFTGNHLMILSCLQKRITPWEMLRNWIFVYIGNLLGSITVAALVVYGHTPSLFDGQLAESIVNIGVAKVSMSFSDAFIRGILCNILVCLAVWMAFAAKKVSGKMMALYFPIFIFVLCGFEHCVANMYYIAAGIFASAEYDMAREGLNWAGFFLKNMLPVTLGNLVGGVGVVGFGYWSVYLMHTPGSHFSIEEEQEELQHAEEY